MIAFSRVLPIIGVLLIAFFVWLIALMKTSSRAERMSQRWIEARWLEDHREETERGLLLQMHPTNEEAEEFMEQWLEEQRRGDG